MFSPVNTSVMTDNKVAIGTEANSKAATTDRMALFFRMVLISCLKAKLLKFEGYFHLMKNEHLIPSHCSCSYCYQFITLFSTEYGKQMHNVFKLSSS